MKFVEKKEFWLVIKSQNLVLFLWKKDEPDFHLQDNKMIKNEENLCFEYEKRIPISSHRQCG